MRNYAITEKFEYYFTLLYFQSTPENKEEMKIPTLKPATMWRIESIIHKTDKDNLIKALKTKGFIQFVDMKKTSITEDQGLAITLPTHIKARATELISKIDPVLDAFKGAGIVKKPDSNDFTEMDKELKEIPSIVHFDRVSKGIETEISPVQKEVLNLNNRLLNIEKEKEALSQGVKTNEKLEQLGIGPSDLAGFKYNKAVVGKVPTPNIGTIENELKDITDLYYLSSKVIDKKDSLLLLLIDREHLAEAMKVMKKAALEETNIPEMLLDYNLQDAKQKISSDMAGFQKEQDETREKIKSIAEKEMTKFMVYKEFLVKAREIEDVNSLFVKTDNVYVFGGWVPESLLGEFEKAVDQGTGGNYVLSSREPEDHEHPPTLLANNKVAEPWEMLTNTYGTPLYKELDPTSFISISFPLIFGLMFGDIGQGLVLMLVGGLVAFKLKVAQAIKNFGKVLLYCGFFATLAGFLYGSVFSLEGHFLEQFLHFSMEGYYWKNPIESINTEGPMLIWLSVKFGMVFLILALLLNIYKYKETVGLKDVIFSPNGFMGIWILVGGYIYFSKYGTEFLDGITDPIVIPALVIPILLVGYGEIALHGKGAGMAIIETIFDFALKYLINSLSFMRIIIMAVLHGVFSSLMADGMAGASNGIVIALIFIGGNLFIIGLETFMAFIQTVRLHYYELFSKFYSGGGTDFMPFRVVLDVYNKYQK